MLLVTYKEIAGSVLVNFGIFGGPWVIYAVSAHHPAPKQSRPLMQSQHDENAHRKSFIKQDKNIPLRSLAGISVMGMCK